MRGNLFDILTRVLCGLCVFTFTQSPRPVGVMQVSQCTVYELTPWPSGASRELVFWDGDRSIANAHRGAERQRIKDALAASKVLKPERKIPWHVSKVSYLALLVILNQIKNNVENYVNLKKGSNCHEPTQCIKSLLIYRRPCTW